MQFNPNSTSGIVYMTRFYAKANSADLSTADIANLTNISLGEIYAELPFLSRQVVFDDPAYTDDPYETFDIVSGTARYSLETDVNTATVSSIRKLAVKDGASGTFQIIPFVSIDDPLAEPFVKGTDGSGVPTMAIRFGGDFVLSPTPNYSSTAGGKYFYDRALDQFVSSDTTVSPGIHESFHELVPLINANRYCIREGKFSTARELEGKIAQQKVSMKKFYGGISGRGQVQGMRVRPDSSK